MLLHARHTRAGNQHVDRSEGGFDIGHHACDRLRVGDVGAESPARAAAGAHGLAGRLRGRLVTSVVHGHAGARPPQRLAHRAADTPRASCHQGHLAGKCLIAHVVHLLPLCSIARDAAGAVPPIGRIIGNLRGEDARSRAATGANRTARRSRRFVSARPGAALPRSLAADCARLMHAGHCPRYPRRWPLGTAVPAADRAYDRHPARGRARACSCVTATSRREMRRRP